MENQENTNLSAEVSAEETSIETFEQLKPTGAYPLQNRFKDKVTWLAISALVLFILKTWGILPKLGVDEAGFNKLVDLAITAAISLGILNNPSDPHSF